MHGAPPTYVFLKSGITAPAGHTCGTHNAHSASSTAITLMHAAARMQRSGGHEKAEQLEQQDGACGGWGRAGGGGAKKRRGHTSRRSFTLAGNPI